jgi:hypothetical protein
MIVWTNRHLAYAEGLEDWHDIINDLEIALEQI